jgi:CBS-domain-containing membrane protein
MPGREDRDNHAMNNLPGESILSDEDLRAALSEMRTYVDITEEDLGKIFALALKHARERLALDIPVGEVMTRSVKCVRKDTAIEEVIRLFSENNISGVPVVDDENRVIGVVSEADVLSITGMKRGHTFKDIMRHILGEPLPERKEGDRVEDIMSSPAITISLDARLHAAATLLDERKIKRLPVVDSHGRVAGIISRADIVRSMGKRWRTSS